MDQAEKDNLIKALQILNDNMMNAINHDKQFMIHALFETDTIPHSVVISSRAVSPKTFSLFKKFHQDLVDFMEGRRELPKPVEELKPAPEPSKPPEPKKKGVQALRIKNDDGSITINFGKQL